ncbi:MAG: NnrS family protein [Burkholderiales bacterium]|nr:NnrS family protein [Burkholderiales bacterium]
MLSSTHPIWLCGFRPFFLAAALGMPLFIWLWVAFLVFGLPLPATAGGPFIWHAHELVFGIGLAAIAGFALTAIPEFTATPAFGGAATRRLIVLWLAGRIAFWSSGPFGASAIAISAAAHLGLLGYLAVLLAPRLWRDPERRHLAFLWALAALAICVAGFYADTLLGEPPARWLHAALGVLMMLIVVAMSRISMRIVNAALEECANPATGIEYRARPPRRNLAIFCIALYTLAELVVPGARIGGWLALATAAALLNLLNDWHVGRALFRRWPLMLYGVYVLMAGGYALMGLSLVLEGGFFSAGRHLAATGAMGLAIYAVLCIAGHVHCGLPPDERLWVPIGAWLIVAGALARAATALPGTPAAMLGASGLLWSAAFVLYTWRMTPLFLAPRADGGRGCEGVLGDKHAVS